MQLPLNQQRHSNVAVVRLTTKGVKLEIACYKNKVISYRSGVETRLDEVLQIDRVFQNVARGAYASIQDIQKALGPDFDEKKALKHILENGELQVAHQERTSEVDEMMKDIATIISQKCVHAVTQRPFPATVIEQSLRTVGAVVKLDQPPKKQALHLMQVLMDSNVIPLVRAKMKVRCTVTEGANTQAVLDWCASQGTSVEAEVQNGVVVLLPPHLYRDIDAFVKSLPGGSANNFVSVIENAVAQTGEGAAADLQAVLAAASLQPPMPSSLKPTPAQVSERSSEHSAVQTASSSSPSDKKSAKGGKGGAKQSKKRKGDDHSSDEEDQENEPSSHKTAPLPSKKIGSAAAMLTISDSDDDDDDGKRKKKAKAAKKANPHPSAAPAVAPKKSNSNAKNDSDSDELVSERKKKRTGGGGADDVPKKQTTAKKPKSQFYDDDEDDDVDYGSEGEEVN